MILRRINKKSPVKATKFFGFILLNFIKLVN